MTQPTGDHYFTGPWRAPKKVNHEAYDYNRLVLPC